MELNLTQVSAFLVLVEERHVGRAARRLHLTPSAVSKRVQGLETQLGVRLLAHDRSGELVLTAAGRRFADPAAAVLRQAKEVAYLARTDARRTVRLGFPAGNEVVLGDFDLVGAARDLREQDPGTRLAALAVPFGETDGVLADHRVDVLITDCVLRRPGVVSEPLPLTDGRVALVPAHHPLAGADSVSGEEVAGYELLHNPHAPAEWMEPFWLADVRPRREARLLTTDADSNTDVVRESLAAGALMVTLDRLSGQLPPQLPPVPITGVAPVRVHAVHRDGHPQALLAPLLAALCRPRIPSGGAAERGREAT